MVHSEGIPHQRSKCQPPWHSDGEWMCNSPNRHCSLVTATRKEPKSAMAISWRTDCLPSGLVKPSCEHAGGTLCKLISVPTWSPPLFLLPRVSSPMEGQSLVLEAKFKTLAQPQSCPEAAAQRCTWRQRVLSELWAWDLTRSLCGRCSDNPLFSANNHSECLLMCNYVYDKEKEDTNEDHILQLLLTVSFYCPNSSVFPLSLQNSFQGPLQKSAASVIDYLRQIINLFGYAWNLLVVN